MRLPLLLLLLTGLVTAWLGHLNHPIRDVSPNYNRTGNTLKSYYEITKVYTIPISVIKSMTAVATVEQAGKRPRDAKIYMGKSKESLTGWKIYDFEWIS